MRTLLALSLLALLFNPGQNPLPPQEGSPVTVIELKWSKTRQPAQKLDPAGTGPAAAMTSADKNFERNRRANDPPWAIDPHTQTVDGRAAAIEKSVQESRAPQSKPVDGFEYRVKVQNASNKIIDILFWEYQFINSADQSNMSRRQFICGAGIKPDKQKELLAFSLSGPSEVVTVGSLTQKSDNPLQQRGVINRVEYTDGSTWQRKDWKANEIKQGYIRALATAWGAEMCRSL